MILCSILFHIDELHSNIHYIYTKLLCADFEGNLRPVEGDRGAFLKNWGDRDLPVIWTPFMILNNLLISLLGYIYLVINP